MIGGNKRIFVFLPFLKNVLIIKDNAVTDIAKHKKKTNVKVGSECGSTLPCSLLRHCSLSLQFHKVKRYQQGNQWKNHRQYNPIVAKRERRKGQTIIYKTLHKKLKIGQHETYSFTFMFYTISITDKKQLKIPKG
jgi:hypothetical protein